METIKIEIPNYLRKVKLSEARKKKYYVKGKNEPVAKKYNNTEHYEWVKFKGQYFLVDVETRERVISNPRAAGTPRFITINGQKIYNGEIDKHVRNKVLSSIKDSFAPYINKLPVITEYPIRIDMEIHDTIREPSSNAMWDVDNRAWTYIKAFQDCLTGNKDKAGKKRNRKFVLKINAIIWTVKTGEDQKIINLLIIDTVLKICLSMKTNGNLLKMK